MALSDDERSLHRYELGERIAMGGMAEVFRAKAYGAHGFEKSLAIKRILPDLAQDPEFENRFIAEAKLAVQLTHANVVQVFDFGRFGGSLFLAMEYVDGPDLAALLKAWQERMRGDAPSDRVIELPLGPALQIAMELVKGLDFAHRRGVVHRDVSPSNILISRAGEVKIADFGIAQAAADLAAARSETRRIMGKWRYMSPEQARGERLTSRSDLFSAGAVMWELFTGRKLFVGDDAEAIVKNVCGMPVPAATSVRPDLPPALDDVLAKLLSRDPDRRFASAGDVLRALLEIAYARTLVATPDDVADLVAKAFPPRPADDTRRGIDDLIAQQLAAVAGGAVRERTETRVTAQADRPPSIVSFVTGERDELGVAQWQLAEGSVDAFAKTQAAADIPAAASAPLDAVPAEIPAAPTVPVTQPVERVARRGASIFAVGAVALVALAAAAVVLLTRDRGAPAPPGLAPVADAPSRTEAELTVSSQPTGASIAIDGVLRPEKTPARLVLPPGRHDLELTLPGHRPRREEVTLTAGERVKIPLSLERRVCELRITTEPEGAEILLDDRPLGTTPLIDDEFAADDAAHELRLRKKGYADLVIPVTLADGTTIAVDRVMEPAIRWGKVKIYVHPWAYVYFEGKKLGETPLVASLPVGRQKVTLDNPELGKKKTVYVDVPARGIGEALNLKMD